MLLKNEGRWPKMAERRIFGRQDMLAAYLAGFMGATDFYDGDMREWSGTELFTRFDQYMTQNHTIQKIEYSAD
jgi:hypothetical protein